MRLNRQRVLYRRAEVVRLAIRESQSLSAEWFNAQCDGDDDDGAVREFNNYRDEVERNKKYNAPHADV